LINEKLRMRKLEREKVFIEGRKSINTMVITRNIVIVKLAVRY